MTLIKDESKSWDQEAKFLTSLPNYRGNPYVRSQKLYEKLMKIRGVVPAEFALFPGRYVSFLNWDCINACSADFLEIFSKF